VVKGMSGEWSMEWLTLLAIDYSRRSWIELQEVQVSNLCGEAANWQQRKFNRITKAG